MAVASGRLRAGLIGLGSMGRHHARLLGSLDGVDLVAVADPAGDPHGAAQGVPLLSSLDELIGKGLDYCVVAVPTALNTGSNSGPSFCILFGTHVPFGDEQLDALYRNHGRYVSGVARTDEANVQAGFILEADAEENQREAAHSSVGK